VLIQRLPFNKAEVFEYNKLDEIEMNVFKDTSIHYLGVAHYWLNDDHQLVRVLWDNNKEFLLQ
jgi:hypothetical protein